jgi:acyl carrier protein
MEELRARLESAAASLGIRGVPSARLAGPLRALELLRSPDCPPTVRELREALARSEGVGVEPEALWALGDELAYDVRVGWSDVDAEGLYDVLFVHKDATSSAPIAFPGPVRGASSFQDWTSYTNKPLRGLALENIGPQLRRFVQQHLPDYMVPASFVLLDELPRASSGKLDRQALPPPELDFSDPRLAYTGPRTPTEARVATIWSELLGLQQIGIDDDFFAALGGHSLLATQVVSRLRDAFQVDVPLRRMFDSSTIAQLAVVIEQLLMEELQRLSDEEAERLVAVPAGVTEVEYVSPH